MINKIMVTGSSGTVGTALCEKLLELKYKLIPVDIKPSMWNQSINRQTIIADLRKPFKTSKSKTPDLIIHLAANARVHDLVVNPQKALDNYLMTHQVLEYARLNNVKKLVFASSREVYGETASKTKRKENSADVKNILSPYTASKFGAEGLIHSYHHCYGIEPVIVRLSNVYGRFDVSERAVPLFIYYALRNRDINIFGNEKKLDFTHTDDAIDGLVRIVKRFSKVAGETLNITRGEGAKIRDVAQIIIDYLGSDSKLNIGQKRTGEISVFAADISKAKRLLGFNPSISVKDGVENNIVWYLNAIKNRRVYDCQRRDLMRRGWA